MLASSSDGLSRSWLFITERYAPGPPVVQMDADVAVTAAVTLWPATIMGPLQSREGKFVPCCRQ